MKMSRAELLLALAPAQAAVPGRPATLSLGLLTPLSAVTLLTAQADILAEVEESPRAGSIPAYSKKRHLTANRFFTVRVTAVAQFSEYFKKFNKLFYNLLFY